MIERIMNMNSSLAPSSIPCGQIWNNFLFSGGGGPELENGGWYPMNREGRIEPSALLEDIFLQTIDAITTRLAVPITAETGW